jgi:hypothetical protein
VWELLNRPAVEQPPGCGLRRLEHLLSGLVTRARDESVNGQQQRPVVGAQREHGGVNMAAVEKFLKHA